MDNLTFHIIHYTKLIRQIQLSLFGKQQLFDVVWRRNSNDILCLNIAAFDVKGLTDCIYFLHISNVSLEIVSKLKSSSKIDHLLPLRMLLSSTDKSNCSLASKVACAWLDAPNIWITF